MSGYILVGCKKDIEVSAEKLTTDRPLSLEIRQEGDALLVENTLQLLDMPNAGTGMG